MQIVLSWTRIFCEERRSSFFRTRWLEGGFYLDVLSALHDDSVVRHRSDFLLEWLASMDYQYGCWVYREIDHPIRNGEEILPRKDNVRSGRRSCCFSVGHDGITCLWSLNIRKCSFPPVEECLSYIARIIVELFSAVSIDFSNEIFEESHLHFSVSYL